jgi:hypothetical protein
LIPLSREPAVLAYHLEELIESANSGDAKQTTVLLANLVWQRPCVCKCQEELKTRKSESSTGDLWQPGYMALPKSREALTRMPERSRSEGSILVKETRALIIATNKTVFLHRHSIEILLCRILYVMGSMGLLED